MIQKILLVFRAIILSLSRYRLSRKAWVKIGAGTIVYITSSVTKHCRGGAIFIGSNCRLGVRPKSYLAGYGSATQLILWGTDSEISIGDNSILNGVHICARTSIRIGKGCIFATGIQILDSDTHIICSTHRLTDLDEPQPVIIGNNVWVGLNAIILKGTVIGDNSVIGAGAIVKGVFPANCVIAGNPARIVKTFDLNDSIKP